MIAYLNSPLLSMYIVLYRYPSHYGTPHRRQTIACQSNPVMVNLTAFRRIPPHSAAFRVYSPQPDEGEEKSAAGTGGQPISDRRRRPVGDEEDPEEGLDEDWGHDVSVIELQNRVPDSSSTPSSSSRDNNKKGKSKSKSKSTPKGSNAGAGSAVAAAAAAVEAAAGAGAAATAETEAQAAAAGEPDGDGPTKRAAQVAV